MNNLKVLFEENLFSDLRLIIEDSNESIILNVHRNILYLSCDFFKKLLTGPFSETKDKSIKITVHNAKITSCVIKKFYDIEEKLLEYPDWMYYLETYRCYDYFGIEIPIDELLDLVVPSEGFELLLQTVDLLDYCDELGHFIIRNLPLDYDINDLSKDLIIDLQRLSNKYKIVCSKDHTIKFFDNKVYKPIKTINHSEIITSLCYDNNNKRIIYGDLNGTIYIHDFFLNKNIFTLQHFQTNKRFPNVIHLAVINDKLISVYFGGEITVRNSLDGTLCYIIKLDENPFLFKVCPHTNCIFHFNTNGFTNVWSIDTGNLIHKFGQFTNTIFNTLKNDLIIYWRENNLILCNYPSMDEIGTLCKEYIFSPLILLNPNKQHILVGCHNGLMDVWNLEKLTLVKTIQLFDIPIVSMTYSPNGGQLIITSCEGEIRILNSDNYEIIHTGYINNDNNILLTIPLHDEEKIEKLNIL
ncbi:putative BTB/POZ domain and WD-repeat protein [Acanthamoeba polyphaga mimivirus]|uniref:BTB/POZ domain and WD-repeat protein n=1 Tax=Acanthamoeba polyphaga mimivirus Kroon TaxID=3069720 RepID=A0A0G2Y7T7_9VIRU|nr:putative BTB/POZ domain and WD-repeat protein [Acanthamoeba polyphaga mimivirus]AKI79887.1 putative BTB/POZ domain and WD-repeat protein [Acanthamoeba polyphaga mimivirus Kroon]